MDKKKDGKRFKQKLYKWIMIASTIVCIAFIITSAYWTSKPEEGDMTYNEFWEYVDSDDVEYVIYDVNGYTFQVKLVKDKKMYKVVNPKYEDFRKDLLEKDVEIKISEQTFGSTLMSFITVIPIFAIYIMIIIVFGKQLLAMNMTSVFHLYNNKENNTTFDDIGGLENTKKEVMSAVSTIQHRDELKKVGCKPCKGIILEGPPGTGKTLIAKAIAHEADVNFISCSGSDFVEMYVGLGASRVRSLWQLAKKNVPCVIFIDEIDALGQSRKHKYSHSENNQTLEQLLQRMDGLDGTEGIMVVGATNNIDAIDEALLRPGRFDKRLHVGNPDSKSDRDSVMEIHLRNKFVADDFNKEYASKLMAGLSGAEIAQSINGAVEIGVMESGDGTITLENLDKSIMKVRLGGVTVQTSKEDEELSAYHEAGHALVYRLLGRSVVKVSVIPFSSGCGGVTIGDFDELNVQSIKTKSWFLDSIKVALGGMLAEEIVYGEHSVGCSNDLEKATEYAIQMYSYFGMGNQLLSLNGIPNDKLKTEYDNEVLKDANELLTTISSELKKEMTQHKDEIVRFGKELMEKKTVLDYKYVP